MISNQINHCNLAQVSFFILEGGGGGRGGVGMKGSSTAPTDFFVPRAKLFYDDVLFGNSVLIRRAICCSLIDFLRICDGPFISTDIILLFCLYVFFFFFFFFLQLPSRKIDCTFSGKMVCYRSTN